MLSIRNISYLLPMCCSFWEKCKNSPKTGLGCSTPLNWWNQNYIIWVPLQLGPRGRKFTYVRQDEPPKLPVSDLKHTHPKKQQQQQQRQGAPSLKCSSYDYPFKKVPFSNNFFIVWLQNSHNDTMHSKNWWNQNYLDASSIRAEGGTSYM